MALGPDELLQIDEALSAPGVDAGVFAQFEPMRLGCTLGVDPLFAAAKRGDRLGIGCAADVRVLAGGPSVGAESVAYALRNDDQASPGAFVEAWATLRQTVGALTAGLAAGPGLGSAPGTGQILVATASGRILDGTSENTLAPALASEIGSRLLVPVDKYSFPSGHASTSLAAALTLGSFYPELLPSLLCWTSWPAGRWAP